MNLIYIPNTITCLRALLVWPFVAFLLSGEYRMAFYTLLIASVSDGVDGYLARKFQWTSVFGSIADPLADKLLLVSSFILLAALGKIPLWVMGLIIARDIFIVTGAGIFYFFYQRIHIQPTIISKINTVSQLILVFLLLTQIAFYAIPNGILLTIIIVVILTTLWSFINYLCIWSKRIYTDWDDENRRTPSLPGLVALLLFVTLFTAVVTTIAIIGIQETSHLLISKIG